MITEFKTIPKEVYYVQTADGCTVLDPDGDTLAEITAPGGYFPGIGAADGGPGTVTFSAPVKRVVGPFDVAPQLLLTLLGQLGGNVGLPAGYTRVEYLEASGAQYIDTKYKPCWDSRIECDFWVLKEGGWATPACAVFGLSVRNENSIITDQYFIFVYTERAYWGVFGEDDLNLDNATNSPFDLRSRVSYTLDKTGLSINGVKSPFIGIQPANYRAEGSCFIAAMRRINNEATPVNLFAIGKFYSFTASENGVTKADFIPCLDPTGAPCMYDLVSRQPFYNLGTGDFTYPTERTTYALRRVLPDWGKLTENGLRRLYHAPANYTGELYDYAVENGYKPIIEPEKPETGYWFPRWTETEDEIVLEWVETEPPTEDYLTQPTE